MYSPTTSCGEIGKILHQIYQAFLGYKTNGTFVEVGANDGKTGSFTYKLAELGWSGLYCEPVPHLFEKCRHNHIQHKNIQCLNIAAGESKGTSKIYYGDTLSTMSENTHELYLQTDWTQSHFIENKTFTIHVDTLDAILQQQEQTIPEKFDILVIDVEGYEESVLKGFTLDKYLPKLIIIEIPDQHESFIGNQKEMEKYKRIRDIIENKYTFFVNDVVDNVYVSKDLVSSNFKQMQDYFRSFIQFKQKYV